MNERKRQIMVAAQHLFIDKGFSNTSIQDILQKTNISKGTFYNYFPSKNACLMAILESVDDETFVKRNEMLIGNSPKDKEIFTKQVAIRMQINREQNIVLLFEEIFHSSDQELREFVKKSHLKEIFWLTKRLVEVYGSQTAPHALDAAILLIGMIQHFVHIWSITSPNPNDITPLVQFVMRRLDAIVPSLIYSNDQLLDEAVYTLLEKSINQHVPSIQEIYDQLIGFQKNLGKESPVSGKEYVQFLITELKTEEPRRFLMETVTKSFLEAFTGTRDEAEAREIAAKIWSSLDIM